LNLLRAPRNAHTFRAVPGPSHPDRTVEPCEVALGCGLGTAGVWRDLGGPARSGAASRRSATSMQFTKLRSGPTWPPSRAPATNSKSTTPTFSLYELRLGGRWKPCWPHSHTPFSLKIRRVKGEERRGKSIERAVNVPVTGVFTALKMCIYPPVYIWGVLVPPRCRLEHLVWVLSLKR
jgi:hypothetical protein